MTSQIFSVRVLLFTALLSLTACGSKLGSAASGDPDAGGSDADAVIGKDILTADQQDGAAKSDAPDTQSLDTLSCPGTEGCACQANAECDNGLCIDNPTDGTKMCATKCVDGCPTGFLCAQVSQGGGDVQSICVPKFGHVCDPCASSKDCASLGLQNAACVDEGALGHFCGAACLADTDCPGTYTCATVATVEGGTSKQCVKQASGKVPYGTCDCSASAAAKKLSTACYAEAKDAAGSIVGQCPGTRSCGDAGLSACSASAAASETCDGVDNDCNGQTDEGSCNDVNPCTKDVCHGAGGCEHLVLDGDACDADASACTEGDACKSGACVPGEAKNCDDKNPCTIDTCEPAKGCVQTPDDGAPCDADGSACTAGDVCKVGKCQKGQLISCDDGNPCTDDSCDPSSGKCVAVAGTDSIPCNDGTKCTSKDVCISGACKGKPVDCDDSNPCTDDVCDAATGCAPSPLTGAPCSDDNPCTLGDVCAGGQCAAGVPKTCAAPGPCYVSSCDPVGGQCKFVAAVDGLGCDDGSACTQGDACSSGNCTGSSKSCDDGNSCTNDSCNAKLGCLSVANVETCSDNNACTVNDACSAGTCSGTALVAATDCDDKNACTNDTCNANLGCVHTANSMPCDDSNLCTVGDTCTATACVSGTNTCGCQADGDCASKEDGNLCNGTLFCDKATLPYSCKVNPATVVVCDTSLDSGCQSMQCVATSGQCLKVAAADNKSCDADGSVCTNGDSCSSGVCKSGPQVSCDDGNPCTDDSCEAKLGCQHVANAAPCNADFSACTANDACVAKVCVAGPAKLCDDLNPCTKDSCDAASGACVVDKTSLDSTSCDADGSVCTTPDSCLAGTCQPGPSANCDDSNPCTDDTCAPTTGCKHVANTAVCSDGNPCTLNDQCASKACVAGAAKVCNDNNDCTNDSCAGGTCVFTNNALPCDDGNLCTSSDVCSSGACGGTAKSCTALDQCHTAGTCNTGTGACTNPNASNGTSCSDGNACTQTDTCQTGVCTGASPVTCSASDSCHTVGTCNTGTGVCSNPNASNGTSCSDDNACTQTDACQAGVCTGASPVTCTALDQCHTAGVCNNGTGLCSNPSASNGTGCNDGNACTQSDGCQAGVCTGASPVTCSALDQCHMAGTCNTGTGLCTNPNASNGTSCSDGNACTQSDACQAGVCTGASPVACTALDQCHTAGTCNPGTGVCTNPNASNGTSCSDGNACTQSDACQTGVCTGANPVTCTALDQCHTAGTCNTGTGVCTNPNASNGAPCSDGNACTQSDGCQAGVCTGASPVTCSALDQCHTAGTCNAGTGVCSNPNASNGTSCSDGNACTQSDACQSGSCVGASPVACSALDQCHTAGTCNTGTGVCTNPNASNGKSCSDSNACTQSDSCQTGVCTGASPVTCTALDACHTAGTCNTGTGVCTNPNASNGTSCSDGNACTNNDVCTTGTCGGTAVICSASDQCHDIGSCSAGACSNPSKSNGVICNDGSACTATDLCTAGVCAGTYACDDGNACTADSCVSLACAHANVANGATCDDGNVCTISDGCQSGVCAGSPAVWSQTYGVSDSQYVTYALSATSDSGFALAASTNAKGAGSDDFWLVRVDSSGKKLWDQTYGGLLADYATAVVQTVDGGFAVAGYTKSKGAGGNDFWLVRTDASGAKTWDQTYGGASSDAAYAVVQTSDGGFAVAGNTASKGAGSNDGWLVRTNASGVKVWDQTYGGASTDYVVAAVVTSDNSFALAGYSSSKGAGGMDYWLVRTDANGNKVWDRTYGGIGYDTARALVQTSDGGFALAGTTASKGAGYNDFWLVRTDSTGNPLWDHTYGTGNDEYSYGLVQTSEGGFAVVGNNANADAWVVRTDVVGNKLWDQSYGGVPGAAALAVAKIGNVGLAIAGVDFASGNPDLWLAHTDLWGNASCATSGACSTYTTTTCDDAKQCTLDLCTAAAGCTHANLPASTPCSDGNACTSGETCNVSAVCTGASNVSNGTACSDGNACTGTDTCTNGACSPGSASTCAANATCDTSVGCVCNSSFWGSGINGGSCGCGGTVTSVGTASGSKSVCTYDWPVWGERPISPNTFKDNGDGTVSDSQSQLMWQQSVSGAYAWAAATTYCDGLTLAGHDDWRLPTVAEGESLIDYPMGSPMISNTFFPFSVATGYWTSVAQAGTTGSNWFTGYLSGHTVSYDAAITPETVRCVRSNGSVQYPTSRFTVGGGGSGTVLDNATGLYWQQAISPSTCTWSATAAIGSAQAYCAALSVGNYSSGWRVPTIRELLSIVDRTVYGPPMNTVVFTGNSTDWYWSSVQRQGSSTTAWQLDFFEGNVVYGDISGANRVRCVR